MNQVVQFDVEFDASDMPISEIRRKVRDMGWPGLHIDIYRMMHGDGKTIVRRLSRRKAYGHDR